MTASEIQCDLGSLHPRLHREIDTDAAFVVIADLKHARHHQAIFAFQCYRGALCGVAFGIADGSYG